MKIRTVLTRDYKNLELEHTHLHAATVVVGKNGQGKTNFLRLLEMAFRKKAKVGTTDQLFLLDGAIPETGLVRFGADRAKVSFKVECSGAKHADLVKMLEAYGMFGNDTTARITFEITETRSSSVSVWQITELKFGVVDVVGPGAVELSGPHRDQVRNYINDEWSNAAVYVPLNRLPLDHRPKLSAGGRPDPARDLPNAIYSLINNADEQEQTIDDVKAIMKRFFGITDVRASVEEREVDGKKEAFVSVKVREQSGHWVPLADVGAGLQQLMVVATILYRANAHILLVEEFETSLSLEVRGTLWKEFKAMLQDSLIDQVVASSHTFWRSEDPTQVTVGPTSLTETQKVDFQKWQEHHWKGYEAGKGLPDTPKREPTEVAVKAPISAPAVKAVKRRAPRKPRD